MQDKIIQSIQELLKKEKLNRKQIYENLLAENIVKPNSEKLVYDVIDYATENGFINPARIKRWNKKRGKLPSVFTIEQLTNLFDNCYRPKLAVVMWLGLFCGLRIKEACSLKVNEVDLKNKKVYVMNSKNPNRSRDGYGKDRIVSIPDIAINPLEKWLNIIDGGKWFIPSMQNPDRHIRTKTIHEQFREILKNCGLSKTDYIINYRAKNHGKKKNMHKTVYKFKFHSLRHTYATYLLEKGVPLENIQRSLGHVSLDTTLIYAKVSDKKTGQFINNAFSRPLELTKKESILTKQNEPKTEPNNFMSARELLQQRLARGEIDIITYRRLLAELEPENTINVVHSTNSN